MNSGLDKVEVNGLKFWVRPDTSDIKAIREVVERKSYGRYKFVPAAGEHWIDLGANVGAFSVWAASQDPSIAIHAYEPDPEMCDLIERNLKLNKLKRQVSIFQSAVVADSRKTVTLHCNSARGNLWRNSIEREWRGGHDIKVPAYHIKKVMSAVPDGSYLKMDIEGTEMPLLEWMLINDHFAVKKLSGMVFEWSFDVDPKIARFRAVVEMLGQMYDNMRNDTITEKMAAVENWPESWFPAARLVWAWND